MQELKNCIRFKDEEITKKAFELLKENGIECEFLKLEIAFSPYVYEGETGAPVIMGTCHCSASNILSESLRQTK